MNKNYVKVEIPTEVYEDGGCHPVFRDKETVALDAAIADAVDGQYALGNKLLVRQTFFGLMQSMADGVRRDGHARQIGDFITVYPVFKGPVDPDRGFDPAVNKVMIRARLLNEMELDITDWTFVDVTPGKRAFTLTRITSGDDGKTVVFTVRGNFSSAKISATLKYVPTPTKQVTITDVTATRGEDTAYLTVKGVNLDGLRGWRVDEANDLHFKAEVFVNGTSQGEQEFYGPNVDPAQEQFGEITCVDFVVGDTVKVILRTDPAKTEFVQEEIVREVIVTQE